MTRYVCVHGHFYQPPRENPWLETVEAEPSAAPHHDWNARITAECYAPNAAARMLGGDGRIDSIVNNYASISFNFGPTLLAWMEAARPAVYAAVLAADRESAARFSGHGSALAQAYNHVILPLADGRDKQTQVVWGLADFERRFGRRAAGLWLPETAVDVASLEVLAAHGVRFTILEPHQARRVRPWAAAGGSGGGGGGWSDVSGGRIDTTRPYRVNLPSGRGIAVFFYDGAIARAVAFERLLASGERFAGRLLAAAVQATAGSAAGESRLVHIATDGETYGHHHRHGEMALAYALREIEASGAARLTNYGEMLERQAPADEVEIVDNTSWSCVHGVDRWREDCGCRSGGQPGWNQAWRAPLRQALDELRDALGLLYEAEAGELFVDPWRARDDYVEVMLDRSPRAVDAFLERQARGATPCGALRVKALTLLEMQRHALLMFTSCGWFFDDLAGLEPLQVMRYAGRAAQLADGFGGGARHESALRRALAWAKSNDPRAGSGRDLYDARVLPTAAGPAQIAARHAARSLFALGAGGEGGAGAGDAGTGDAGAGDAGTGDAGAGEAGTGQAGAGDGGARQAGAGRGDVGGEAGVCRLYHHEIEVRDSVRRVRDGARLALGRLRLRVLATGAEHELCCAALDRGDLRPLAAAREVGDGAAGAVGDAGRFGESEWRAATAEIERAFAAGDLDAAADAITAHLDGGRGSAGAAVGGRAGDGAVTAARGAAERWAGLALPGDEQREVLGLALEEIEGRLAAMGQEFAAVAEAVGGAGGGVAPAGASRRAMDLAVNAGLRRALGDTGEEAAVLRRRLDEAARLGVVLDAPGLAAALAGSLAELLARLEREPLAAATLARAAERAALACAAPFTVDLWAAQNRCHALREAVYAARRAAAAAGDAAAGEWISQFHHLAQALSVGVGLGRTGS